MTDNDKFCVICKEYKPSTKTGDLAVFKGARKQYLGCVCGECAKMLIEQHLRYEKERKERERKEREKEENERKEKYIKENKDKEVKEKENKGEESKESSSLISFSVKNTLYEESLSRLYEYIRRLYQAYGYNTKLHKRNTVQRLKAIITSKNKQDRLYPIQILLAYKAYLKSCSEENKETKYVKQSDTFLSKYVYDYADSIDIYFREKMEERFGIDWDKKHIKVVLVE